MTDTHGRPWLLLTHVDFEGLGMLRPILTQAGVHMHHVRAWRDRVPDTDELDTFDGVVAMGGPMHALADDEHPFLAAERTLLASAARRGMPVLGICLGAQLLAAGLGASVTRMPEPEYGLGTVTVTAQGRHDPVFADEPAPQVVHWHDDEAAPPAGATILASTTQCHNQAFRWGSRAYGLQFHLELDTEALHLAAPHLPPTLQHQLHSLTTGQVERAKLLSKLAIHLTTSPASTPQTTNPRAVIGSTERRTPGGRHVA